MRATTCYGHTEPIMSDNAKQTAAVGEAARTPAARAPRRLVVQLLLIALAGALALVIACDGGGGVNTQVTFRAVLIEPPTGSIGRGCGSGGSCLDTVRVTFNRSIDTTAVLDPLNRPRYFLASLSGTGFILDSLGTTVSNEMRTLIIPFQFVPGNTYTFTMLAAQDTDGNQLENTARTTFTMGNCTNPCP
jgi:hypothetical protein